MNPSPEAGELTPERLAELDALIERIGAALEGQWATGIAIPNDTPVTFDDIANLLNSAAYARSSVVEAEGELKDTQAQLRATQARLEEATSAVERQQRRIGQLEEAPQMTIEWLKVRSQHEARAALAEQEASRCKAEAERAVEALEPYLAPDGSIYLTRDGIGINEAVRSALTSLRGDAT